MKSLSLLVALAFTVVACRGSDDNPNPDRPDAANVDDVTIQQVQGDLPQDTTINVRGVVVTAIDNFGDRKGNFWVMEPTGGEFSGVVVYGAQLEQVADLAVGDIVDVESVIKREFALDDDLSGRKTTELMPPDGGQINVVKISDGTPPTPNLVDIAAILAIEDEAARDAELEKWEGVLIKISTLGVTQTPRPIGTADPTFQELRVTGNFRIDTSLAAFPSPIALNDCFASITGIGDYFYNYKLLLRETDEMVAGDGCAELPINTVQEIQTGVATGMVVLEDVAITAFSRDRKHLWVADSLTAAVNQGVYLYRGPNATALSGQFVVGATVNVSGTVEEFDIGMPPAGDKLTEVGFTNVTFVAAPAGTVTPLAAMASVLGDIGAAGEPYEGVLVTAQGPLEVTSNTLGGDKVELTDGDGARIILDDDAFDFAATAFPVGTCYAQVTGVMSVQLTDNVRTLNPRAMNDLVTGNACNN